MDRVRVAYTLEQCWHRVPGGTGVAALRIAEAMGPHNDVRLLGVAGRHRRLPREPWVPEIPVAHLPIASPWLYETWLRMQWPKVEVATGPVDIAHATTLIPCPTDAKLVVTLHDLAFLHDPSQFTRHGVRVFRKSLRQIRQRADIVLCCSQATMDDCVAAGIGADRLRLVPLGVETTRADHDEIERVRAAHDLPDEYILFVGTVEPRKNLRGLVAALELMGDAALPLVVAGAEGWGESGVDDSRRRSLPRIRAERRSRRAVRRRQRVLLSERARRLRTACAGSDGAGRPRRHQSRHGDRRDRGHGRGAGGSEGPDRHRPRNRGSRPPTQGAVRQRSRACATP